VVKVKKNPHLKGGGFVFNDIYNKLKIMWQANVTIKNNTDYNLTIDGVGPGNTTTGPNSSTQWSSQEVHNTKSLLFWVQENVWYMQSNLSFGPEAGVYVDRGWMADNDQTISMTANANGKEWIQTLNGGETLLQWNEFENGGDITLTFNKQ
jgi:hypothetical protein